MMTRGWGVLLVATGIAGGVSGAQAVPVPASAEQGVLANRLNQVLAPLVAEADIVPSVRIEKLDGSLVFDRRGDEAFVIASNVKVFTTAAALLALGPQYRWTTTAQIEGERLWITGTGDPSLRTLGSRVVENEFLDDLAKTLLQAHPAGFTELVLDVRAFPDPPRHPLWPEDQWQADYCAPVLAFSLEGGILEFSEIGGALRTLPDVKGAFQVERAESGNAKNWSASWVGARDRVVVRGSGAGKAPLRLADADPQRLALRWLRAGLETRGVRCGLARSAAVGEVTPSTPAVFKHRSAWTLAEAVTACNKESDNFIAEVLVRTLGRERGGEGSLAVGLQAVRAVLGAAGANVVTLDLVDGCGLARAEDRSVNRASPAALCSALRIMGGASAGAAGPVFFDSLVVGGVEEKLKDRFRAAEFQPMRVRAKTGWIRGASSLSGYLLAPDGQVLVFAVVVNYRSDGTARTNNSRFRDVQEQLLSEVLRAWPTTPR